MSLVLTEELEPGILLVTMNRPDRLNALSQGLIAELHATFERINTDRDVRVVILTGAGRGFCSGDDLKGVEGEHGAPGTDGMGQIPLILLTQEHLASLHERIHRLRQPVIAAVNGAAVGGGFALALSCDIRYASESARFGSVFITLGVSSCDMGTSYLLPRLVGASRSAELMLTGRIFDARRGARDEPGARRRPRRRRRRPGARHRAPDRRQRAARGLDDQGDDVADDRFAELPPRTRHGEPDPGDVHPDR